MDNKDMSAVNRGDFLKKRRILAELKRLASFVEFPKLMLMSTILLAKWGFFYIGDGTNDQVKCARCGRVRENWKSANLKGDLHNPLCPFEGTHKDKNEVDIRYATVSDDSRASHLASRSHQRDSARSVDSVDGSIYPEIGVSDNNCCIGSAGCDNCVGESSKTMTGTLTTGEKEIENSGSSMIVTAAAGHARENPEKCVGLRHKDHVGAVSRWEDNVQPSSVTTTEECDRSQQPKAGAETTVVVGTEDTVQEDAEDIEDTGQEEIQNTCEIGQEANVGALVDGNPDFALSQKRMESVSECPDAHSLCVEQAASDGFYFTSVIKRFCCFSCGLVVQPNQVDENIAATHETLSAACPFVRLLRKSREGLIDNFRYIRYAIFMEETTFFEPGAVARHQTTSNLSIKYKVLYNIVSSIISAIEPIGCPVNLILAEMDNVIMLGRPLKALTVLRGLVANRQIRLSVQNREQLMKLMVDNDAKRSQLMCKVCTRNEIQMLFLPCRHPVVCIFCDALFIRCPVCSGIIDERIHINFRSISSCM